MPRFRLNKEGPVKLDSLADEASLKARLEQERMAKGFGLAWGLIGLIGLVLLVVAVIAISTYPDLNELRSYFGPGATPAELRDLRDGWFSDVKDLLQLLVVSLLVPLLATLIGYIFGRQASSSR